MTESWRTKRNTLSGLIKNLSDRHGGDDVAWLTDYTNDIVFEHSENLDIPIRCFRELLM